jgi:hypothetical protein
VQNTGVTTGPIAGQRTTVPASSQATRGARMEPLASVTAAARTSRHGNAPQIPAAETDAAGFRTIDHNPDRRRTDRREGAPSSAFMAQHIAQEVTPEYPGFDQHQAGARAYTLRRDSLVEILGSVNRIDIHI